MNTITVTLELGPESKALLNQLLEALKSTGCNCHPGDVQAPETPANNEPPEVVDEGAEPELPTYTRDDVQALVQTLAGPKTTANPYGGKRTKTREIVKKYADKVSDIPADKFGEVMAELLKLKEEQ